MISAGQRVQVLTKSDKQFSGALVSRYDGDKDSAVVIKRRGKTMVIPGGNIEYVESEAERRAC